MDSTFNLTSNVSINMISNEILTRKQCKNNAMYPQLMIMNAFDI
jgi:hypothetical protein